MTAHGLILAEPAQQMGMPPALLLRRGGITVKPMTAADVPALIEMGARMHAASRYAGKDYSREKLARMGTKWLANPASCFCAVAWHHDQPVGFFVGLVIEFFFGHDRSAHDVLLFVDESARGGAAARLLVTAYRRWARAAGVSADAIYAGVSAPADAVTRERTYRFYERLGGVEVGRTFMIGGGEHV